MNVMINAISAKRGGAVSYLSNVLPELSKQLGGESKSHITVWRGTMSTDNIADLKGVEYRVDQWATGSSGAVGGGLRHRVWFDQVKLPRMLRAEKTEVLFSSANFGPLYCPCRQVLLVRNPIYFDATYLERMKSLKVKAFYFLQRQLTLRCIKSADIVLFPTQAMLDMVTQYTNRRGSNWSVAPYGTRHDLFQPALERSEKERMAIRLLNVSLYSDQKNLGVLLQAVKALHQAQPRRYFLQLTAGFRQDWLGDDPFFPNFSSERAMFRSLQAEGIVEDVDWKSYGSLPALYQQADIFVFPSYTESFGHPMVEAMATGLPIVAADVPVNREMCGDAAVYFPPFDVGACAECIQKVAEDSKLLGRLRAESLTRAQTFTWEKHAAELVKAFRSDNAPTNQLTTCPSMGR
jgi:glycosyltransferase involved in cell wall biosynthesis